MKKKGTRKIRKNKRTTQRRKNRSYKRMRGGVLTFTSNMKRDLTPNTDPDNRNLASRLTDNLRHLCYEDKTGAQNNNLTIARQVVTRAGSNLTDDKKQILNESFAALFEIDIDNLRQLIIPSTNITLDTYQEKALNELCKLYDLIYRLNTLCLSESRLDMLDGKKFRERFEYIITGKIFIKKTPVISMSLDKVDSSLRELNLILFPNFLNQIIKCLLK
jgi:hypothetical protein